MKKLVVLLYVALCVIGIVFCAWADDGGIAINAVNFPDPNMRAYVSSVFDGGYRNSEGKWVGKGDGFLHQPELVGATGMAYDNPQTTKGVEYFFALEVLGCRHGNLTEIDVSANRALLQLDCEDNNLTELNLQNNTALYHLHCYENHLKALDVSHNQALKLLMCGTNPIGNLDVSHNPLLEILCCGSNDLRVLDVSNNPLLTRLDCWGNHLAELDLSQNTMLSEVLLGVQEVVGLKVKKVLEGYQVCLKDYVSNPENIVSIGYVRNGDTDTYTEISSFDRGTGIALYENNPEAICYFYNTHSPNDDLLCVVIKRSLNIVALERSGFGIDGLIIHDMTDNSYLNYSGNALTESNISGYSDSDYGKLGLAADGNSRLILRVQTDKPGTVSFSFNDDIGAKLESLSRKELSASDQLSSTEINSDTHQVSAVLVAPERFPNGKDFPYDKFKVHVKFTDEDGEITEDDLELKLEATPVILIHGLRDEGANCFGVGKNSGIWHTLRQNGFRDIRIWNYDGSRGPEDLLSGVGFANPLFRTLGEVFDKYLNRGIVCTRADFICHSMGGLMARKFLEETGKELINGNNWSERSYKQGMVRRVITIATPHRGSPWADIMIEGSSNPMFWPIRQILYILMNISAGKLGYFDKNSDSAFRDLMTTAPRSYGFPSDVPMYSIYGDVKDIVKAFSQYIGNAGTWIGNLAKLAGPHVAVIMQVVGSSMEFSAWLADDVINGNVFKGEGHDMIVSVPSAAGDFAGSESGYKGLDYMHTSICRQDNIGIEVVNLLRGPVDVFKKFGASGKTAVNKSSSTPKNIASNLTVSNSVIEKASSSGSNNTGSEQMKFIEAINLKIEPSVFTITDNSSQTVNFNVTVSNPTTYDIYCAVQDGNSYRLFKFPDSNDGKTFSARLFFASQDFGVMNAFCFSHNPNDSEGKSLHVSNITKILALSDVTNANIVSLDFTGKTTAYTNVNSETPAGLFAVDADGRYYDVSSPLAGTQWTLTEIARVNDNGYIHGLKEGNTTLTATFRGLTASVDVEVSAALVEDYSISGDVDVEFDKPSLSSSDVRISATEGTAITAVTITATPADNLTWSVSGSLPKGLSCNETTESFTISGTPSAGTAGTYTYTVTASNPAGSTNALITVTVLAPRVPDYPKSKEINPEIPSSVAEAIADMTPEELAHVENLIIGYNITSLTGIEKLINLKALNLSGATSLTEVNLNDNSSVKEVHLSGNSSVAMLNLAYSQIEIVNAEGCKSLKEVNIEGNKTIRELMVSETNISSLNAKGCENLEFLECSSSKINSLKLEGCVNLKQLDFAGNAMRKFNAESFTMLEILTCGGQKERVQTFEHTFNLFSFIMSDQVSGFTNENKVLNVKGYDAFGKEISSQYNPKTGEVTFSQNPAKVTYDYDTGIDNVLMDVSILAESETSSVPDTDSSGGGCTSSNTSMSLLVIILVYAFRFAIILKKQ